jgi:hypothetical protein
LRLPSIRPLPPVSLLAVRMPLLGEISLSRTARNLPSWLSRSRRAVLPLAALACLLALVTQATLLEAAARFAPQPVEGLLLSLAEQVRVIRAPTRDGLRWIEVDDPRTRRADKLQTARK